MNHPKSRLFLLPVLILVFSLACNGSEALPLGFSGNIHHSIFLEMTDPAWQALPEVLTISYNIHPASGFSYNAPAGWEVRNSNFGVVLHSPESVFFSISLINTGYKISDSSLVKLASAIEKNNYSTKTGYKESSFEMQPLTHSVVVEKTYTLNGILKMTRSIYQQMGQSLFVVEMTGNHTEIAADPKYDQLFILFNKSIKPQSSAVDSLPAYNSHWTFTLPDKALSIAVPVGWQQNDDRQIGKVLQQEFWSPDQNAVIESISFSTGEIIQLGYAGDYAINWLNSKYSNGFNDVKVFSEIIMNDQIEKLEWSSRRGGFSGVTFFEIHNKTEVVVLTTAWSRLFTDIYSPVMDVTLLSYMVDNQIQ